MNNPIIICFFDVFSSDTLFFRFYFVSLPTNKTTMAKKFNFREVPIGYQLCFNEQCPKRDDRTRSLSQCLDR